MKTTNSLEVDFDSGAVWYKSTIGHGAPIRFTPEHIEKNPEMLNSIPPQEAYLLGVILTSQAKGDFVFVDSPKPRYKLFNFISIMFCTIFFISNILSSKLTTFFGLTVTGAFLIFPLSYIASYILGDVYGFQNIRRVIWSTAAALILFDLSVLMVVFINPSPVWHLQADFQAVFLHIFRTYASSTISFIVAFFISSYILQKRKVLKKGGTLFQRIFCSLLVSEIIGTGLFCFLAFYGMWPVLDMIKFIMLSYVSKIVYELTVYPIITKPIINKIKKIENIDTIDIGTDFTPFKWQVTYTNKNNIYCQDD